MITTEIVKIKSADTKSRFENKRETRAAKDSYFTSLELVKILFRFDRLS